MEVTKRRVFKTELSSVQNFCWWMIIDDYRLFFLAVVLLCIHWVYIGGIVFCVCVFVCNSHHSLWESPSAGVSSCGFCGCLGQSFDVPPAADLSCCDKHSEILRDFHARMPTGYNTIDISYHITNNIDTEFHTVLECLRILFSSASLDFNLFALVSRSE
jgi:hypothetical protein